MGSQIKRYFDKIIKKKKDTKEQHPIDRLKEEFTGTIPTENKGFFGYEVSPQQLEENKKRTELTTQKSQTIQTIKNGGLAGKSALRNLIFNSNPVVDIDLTGDNFKEFKERTKDSNLIIQDKKGEIIIHSVPDAQDLQEARERLASYHEKSPVMSEEELNSLSEDIIDKIENKDKKIIRI